MNLDFSWLKFIPDWVQLLILLALWLLLWLIIKSIVFSRLKKYVSIPFIWDNQVLKALNFPFWLLILAGTIRISMDVMDIPKRLDKLFTTFSVVLLSLAMILVLSRVLVLLFRSFTLKHRGFSFNSGFIIGLIHIVIWGIGLLILLDTLGVNITPFIASLGIGSIAIGLALQDTLNNLFSGLYLMIDRPIHLEDFVKLDNGQEGFIKKIGWRSTYIQLPPNNMLIIPNSKLASNILTNYNLPDKEVAFSIELGVSYNSDLNQVERVTLEVARAVLKEVKGGVPSFEPALQYQSFTDSSIHLIVALRVVDFSYSAPLKHEFIKRLHQRYQKEGIEIPFPQRTIHLKTIKDLN